MQIRELKQSQRGRGRWLVKLEDGTALKVGENQIVAFGLCSGKELSEQELAALQVTVRRSDLQEKAVNFLSHRSQSRQEMIRRLENWGAEPEECTEICDRLEELGLVNDADYAARIVDYYAEQGYGVFRMRDELYRRGIPRELWNRALKKVESPEHTLDRLVAKRMAGKTPDRKELNRTASWLARRGYDWDTVREAIRRYQDSCDGADFDDFD